MDAWLDANLTPMLCEFLADRFQVRCLHVRDVGLGNSDDGSIFEAARRAGVILITRDEDFVSLVTSRGAPPSIVHLAGPNLRLDILRLALVQHLGRAFELIRSGSPLVQINLGAFVDKA